MRRQLQEVSSSSPSPRNVAARLMNRESQPRSPFAFRRATVESFDNFKLKRQYDLHNSNDEEKLISQAFRRRSKITEIICTDTLLITLTFSGVCTAFSRDSNTRICIINASPQEVIRSIFWNKENNSLLTISVAQGDTSSSLSCRSTPLRDIAANQPQSTTRRLFPSESLEWPGFVELDELNRKIITHSANTSTFKIWDLRTYELLYELSDALIHEVKVSPGILLVIYQRPPGSATLTLSIYEVDTGKLVHTFHCQLNRTKRIDFIEQYGDKLLLKQVNENLRIIDIQSRSEVSMSNPELSSMRNCIYLYQLQRFLTYDERSAHVWNFRGEKVTTFEELTLQPSESQPLHISANQEYLFSLCKAPDNRPCIAVSDLRNGRILCRLFVPADHTERDLVACISALSYDEAKHELLSGTADGRVLVWTA